MTLLPLDPYTTVFTVGFLYTIMPLTVWTVLRGRHDALTTTLWCVGALLSGVAYILYAMRPVLADWATLYLANLANYLAYAMRWAALRRERGCATLARRVALLLLLLGLVYAASVDLGPRARIAYSSLVLSLGSLALAWEAWRLARETSSRSAMMVAVTYLLLGASALVRLAMVLLRPEQPDVFNFSAEVYAVILAGVLTALWGNIGYLGVAMENAQRQESRRREELAAAQARSEAAEAKAAELKALSDEREELLRVISHEARQPLHNAQAVLQGVDETLHTGAAADEAAAARVARARSVLRQITASLDNTLAASTLLVDAQRPAVLRDADIEMLVDLCLGDLPPTERTRVDVVHQTDIRTAAIDVGLMRLALRNLLDNALAYTTPGARVTLRVADSDEPLALLLEVADPGPGIPRALLPRLFERGVRGRNDRHGQGLGLYIVRRAVERQGGTVAVRSGADGTVFTLTVPQGVEP